MQKIAPQPSSFPGASALADRYTIERELGRGGMATVYLAEERKHGRKVAIKVLRPELSASVGAERFLREIRIAARLAHPHIVPLIDSGEADGLLYYVSAFVAGGSLRDRLVRERVLPLRDALRIARDIGAGLDYVHRSGLVHRDVKPENVLFADGLALLADFGIAGVCCGPETALVTDEIVTESGIALGTPEYMSPEQAAGERDLGSRSDVYSFGCVVYEMLAGEPPFTGPSARATMARHVTEPPVPLRAHRAELPQALDTAIGRALAKDPGHRYASVADFVAELQAAEQSTAAAIRTRATRSIAVLPFVNASPDPENEYLSDGVTDELIDVLSKLGNLRVASRTSVFALKGKPLDVRAIGALLGASAVLEGTVRKSGDRLRVTAQLTSTDDGRLLWSQRYDRTLDDVFAVQDELARTIANTLRTVWLTDLAEPHTTRGTGSVKAYGLYLRGRWAMNKRTQEGVAEAITFFEKAVAEDPGYALAYTGLSDAWSLQLDYRSVPVQEGLERAEGYARQALALDEALPEAHASLAWTSFIYHWDWAAAERDFRRAIELDPRYPAAHQWYAFLLSAQGRHEEALVEAHTAQELDPAAVSARRNLAWQYYYARRFERARHHLWAAIELNPMAEETYRVLGLTMAVEGLLEDAVRTLREAVAMPGAGSYTLVALGYALGRSGERAEAERVLRELETRRGADYVSPNSFATVLLGLGERERALDFMEASHAERRGWLVYMMVNPIFDPVRDHPRFDALARAMRWR